MGTLLRLKDHIGCQDIRGAIYGATFVMDGLINWLAIEGTERAHPDTEAWFTPQKATALVEAIKLMQEADEQLLIALGEEKK